MDSTEISFRTKIQLSDVENLVNLARSTGYFNDEEVMIVQELVQETLDQPKSGYCWIIAENERIPVGFTCYGSIAGSLNTWDLYWIVVAQNLRGGGIGKKLIRQTEHDVKANNGALLIAETSGRQQYQDTHSFYQRCGYTLEATIKDFYAPLDDKLFYVKRM
ncbi:MAG: GNAT family N-acetyltransferase [Salinivirgaceae bacterium]|nr:GNAT family N-acetyltransferase [Salinivirgaceae bacterium]MDD4746771.1 GNAT family N-acetyltransferase [Salinivirgaceae bacterium]MDY0280629.1 GNAT family N-acetyltransferase [Salinivirgaceae bacterium]